MIKDFFKAIQNKTRLNQRAVVFSTCVIVSMAFWFTTSMSRYYETIITIPLSYRNLPITKHIESDLPPDLNFYFKGTGFELFGLELRQRPDSIVVDLSASVDRFGRIRLPSDSLRKQFKSELKAYKVTPDLITPDLSIRKGKRVPVVLEAKISYRDRFRLKGRIVLRPDSVDIAGPEELLSKIKYITTEKITLSDIHKDYFGGVNLSKNLPEGVQLSPPYIHYLIPVSEYTEGIVELPVELPISLQSKITLIPSKVKISYQVELSRYNQITPEDFLAYTDISLANLPSAVEIKLKRMPHGIVNVRISPQFVDYLIKNE